VLLFGNVCRELYHEVSVFLFADLIEHLYQILRDLILFVFVTVSNYFVGLFSFIFDSELLFEFVAHFFNIFIYTFHYFHKGCPIATLVCLIFITTAEQIIGYKKY